MWDALQALLRAVAALIEQLFSTAFAPLWSSLSSYGATLQHDVQSAAGNITRGSVPQKYLNQFWSDFGEPVFILGLAASAAVMIGITFVTGVTLGAGFLISLLVGLIFSLALQQLQGQTNASVSELSNIEQPGPSAVFAVEAVTNATNPSIKSQSNYSLTWDTIANIYEWPATLLSSVVAYRMIAAAYYSDQPLLLPIIAFALAVPGMGLTLAAADSGNWEESILADGVAGVGLGLDIFTLTKPSNQVGPIGTLNYLTAALDGSTWLISLGELGKL